MVDPRRTSAPLDARSPFPRRFGAWLNERFPPANGVLALLLWAAALVWGRAQASSGPIRLEAADAFGFLGAYSFFFMLRVFDEHKDYALDCRVHPERVLQRGLITRGHLKVAGGIAIAIQLGVSILLDRGVGPITIAWLATFAWSLLMAFEFFAGRWLKPRLVLYASSHMLVTPLAVHWMVRMGSGEGRLPIEGALLPATSFLIGAAFEIARKLRAPEDERPGVDSYTRVLGTRGASIALASVVALACGGFIWMCGLLGGVAALASQGLLFGVALGVGRMTAAFAKTPTRRSATSLETMVGVSVILSLAFLIGTALLGRGVAAT